MKKIIYKFTSDNKSSNYPFNTTVVNILEEDLLDWMRGPLQFLRRPPQSLPSSTYLKIKKLPYGCIFKIIINKYK